jgi:thioredoxin 1
MAQAKTVTDASFDADVLKSDKPVIVDFWAPWCAPCRQVSPILDEIAAAHADKITVVKVNSDENPAVTARYGVTALPTLAVYSGGELVKTVVGAKPKPMLLREFSPWLG